MIERIVQAGRSTFFCPVPDVRSATGFVPRRRVRCSGAAAAARAPSRRSGSSTHGERHDRPVRLGPSAAGRPGLAAAGARRGPGRRRRALVRAADRRRPPTTRPAPGRPRGGLPAGDTSQAHLDRGPGRAARPRAGAPWACRPTALERMQPWMAELTLSLADDASAGRQRRPNRASKGSSRATTPDGAAAGRSRPPSQQIGFLADAPHGDQIASLDETSRRDRGAADILPATWWTNGWPATSPGSRRRARRRCGRISPHAVSSA